jgi:ribonuclease PH
MRIDGRALDALRPVKMTPGYVVHPEGSVLIEMGETRVLCNATLTEQVPAWLAGTGRGWVTAEYALLPRSTHTRTPRETKGLGGRTQEIRRLIGRSLRAAVDLEALGERQVILDCDVLQADGGTRTAAITGGYVALALALRELIQAGVLSSHVLSTAVAAVSVGLIDGEPMLDLCYAEDHRADADFNIVMTAGGQFVEVQGTAEGATFDRATMDRLLDLAVEGIAQLLRIQQITLGGGSLVGNCNTDRRTCR